MVDDNSGKAPSLKIGYILSIIFLTLTSFVLYSFLPWVIAVTLHWPITMSDVLKSSVPQVENAVLWQGKLCVPNLLVDAFNPGVQQQSLTVVDLKTNTSHEIPLPGIGAGLKLVEDGPILWGISGSDVIRIEGTDVQKVSTGTTLKTERPFLYEGKLAVFIESKSVLDESPKSFLHTWTGAAWQNVGQVLLPPIFDGSNDDDETAKMRSNLIPFDGASDIVVVNFDGRMRLFCSDGTKVLYSPSLEIIPVGMASATSPENAPSAVPVWTLVGTYSNCQVGADAQGLVLVDPEKTSFKGPMVMTSGVKSTTKVVRLVEGAWKEVFQIEEKGFVVERTLVSDGQKAMLVSQSLREKLGVAEIEANGSKLTQVAVSSGPVMNQLAKTMQYLWWVGLVVALVYAMLVTRLMKAYCPDLYEFGNMTVELATFTRRLLAKGVDWLLIFGPTTLAQWVFIGSQTKLQEWLGEKISNVEMRELAILGFAITCYLLAWLITIGILEGRWGVSPGKWLLGLRVVGTTLRPCGFFRAVLRELFMLIDGILCCGWLPGAFTSTLTICRQRLGDLIADTIVIRAPRPKL